MVIVLRNPKMKNIRIQRTDHAWYYVLRDNKVFVQDE